MLATMRSLLTESAASAVIAVDSARGASLSEIAAVTERPVSSIQRAVERLIQGGVVRRTTPRGPLVFRPDAPRDALRELAGWTLGRKRVSEISTRARSLAGSRESRLPPTVRHRVVRDNLPKAIDAIVKAYDPESVILFGSQARGDARADSDVDLLVLFDRVVNRPESEVAIRRLLRDAPFAKDVIVASTGDPSRAAAGTAIAEAIHDGVIVYER